MSWNTILRVELIVLIVGCIYYTLFLFFPQYFMGEQLSEDPMAWSGFGVLIVGIIAARLRQSLFPNRVRSLIDSGAIRSEFGSADELIEQVAREATKRTFWIFVPLVLLYLIGISQVYSNETGKIHLIVGGSMGVWLVSTRFAYGVATGIAAARLSGKSSVFVLNPGHMDRASGFGQLGFFYFNQALILLLPTFFMLFWLVYANINIGQFERDKLINEVAQRVVDDRNYISSLSEQVADYISCRTDEYAFLQDCDRGELYFIWGAQFYALIFFNLIIFTLSWVWPMALLARRMRDFHNRYIRPEVRRLELVVLKAREDFAEKIENLKDELHFEDYHVNTQAHADRLAVYRACPTFPIPIWTVLTTLVSNVSAVFGLLGAAVL